MLFRKRRQSDEQLLAMMRGQEAEREAALHYIYVEAGWCSIARRLLRANGSSREEAEDAIQEAMIVLDNHVRNYQYQQAASLKNFFIGICKGRWRSNRRSRQRLDYTDQPLPPDAAHNREPEVLMLEKEQKDLVRQMLRTLDERCRDLLSLYRLSYSMEEIAVEMDLGNANNARQRVHQCREKLSKLIASHPHFQELSQRTL